MKALQSNWIVLGLLGMLTYLGTTFALMRDLDVQPHAAEEPDAAHVVNTTGPSWEFNNPELDQLIADLRREREHLTEREKQLDELAARLQAEKAEITRATNAVGQLQRDFDQNVTRLKEEEQANLKKLAKLYTTMSADGAALVMKELPDDTLVKLFAIMKEAEIAPLLELLSKPNAADAKRVAVLTDRYRLLQSRTISTNRPPAP
ncbi:MAG: flaA [Limisphaerales bacterium]|nr:MAG: flaA [Limisphaerales bacterium]KAG0507091.1 MAG: flaA [Limisphaerales bacterium]TXT49295.1 MAG: flaA [Limisphaerales bacterium]